MRLERIKDPVSREMERFIIRLVTEIETLSDRIKKLKKEAKNLP